MSVSGLVNNLHLLLTFFNVTATQITITFTSQLCVAFMFAHFSPFILNFVLMIIRCIKPYIEMLGYVCVCVHMHIYIYETWRNIYIYKKIQMINLETVVCPWNLKETSSFLILQTEHSSGVSSAEKRERWTHEVGMFIHLLNKYSRG